MKDAVTEVRYQALRAKLNDLQYYQPLSPESSLLTEKLLADVIASVERFQTLKGQSDDQAERLRQVSAELDALQGENPRLQAENNALHLELIEAGETAERREAEARLRLKSLEDEIENVRFAVQQAENEGAKLERELDALRSKALRAFGVVAEDPPQLAAAPAEWGPPVGVGEGSAAGDVAPLPCLVSGAAAENLREKAKAMARALEDCDRQIASLEQETAARSRQALKWEEAAAAAGRRTAEEGPDLGVVKDRADTRRLEERLAELKASVANRTTSSVELEQECAQLEAEREAVESEAESLSVNVCGLRREEVEAAVRAGHRLRQRRERDTAEEERLRSALRTHEEAVEQGAELARLNAALSAEAREVALAARRTSEAHGRGVGELKATLLREEERGAEERKRLGNQTSQLEQRVEVAEAACQDAEASRMELEQKVERAQASAEECLQQLESKSAEIQSVIFSGARVEQRSQQSRSQVELLTSCLQGLQGEKEMLLAHLGEKQRSLHQEALECVELKLQAQNLKAIVDSTDATRGEWSEDLACAMRSLQRAHTHLNEAKQRRDAVQGAKEKLDAETSAIRAGVEAVSQQREALSAEVDAWTEELQGESRLGEAAQAQVTELENRLLNLENQSRARQEEGFAEERRVNDVLKVLQDEVRAAYDERRRLESLEGQESAQLHECVMRSEHGMTEMQAEFEEAMRRHDRVVAELAQAEARQRREEALLQELGERTAEREEAIGRIAEARAMLREELSAGRSEVQTQEATVAKLRAELEEQARCREEVARGCSSLGAALERCRTETQRARSAEAACAEELSSTSMRLEVITAQRDQLHGDVEELSALVSSGEESRELLSSEMRDMQDALERERMHTQNASRNASAWGEEERAMESEVETLRKAAASIDAERDTKQRLADMRTEELSDMQQTMDDQQHVIAETQELLDHLRAAIDQQASQLTQQQAFRLAQHQEIQALTDNVMKLKSETQESSAEASAILDDLMHMTRENQALHEEVRVLELKVTSLANSAREQVAEQEVSLQQLQAIELERDDVVRLYRQVSLHVHHQSARLESLKLEADDARGAVADLRAAVGRGLEHEHEERRRASQMHLDAEVQEEQLRDMVDLVARAEQETQAALAEDARLEAEVGAAAAARRGADERVALHAHTVATLRHRRQQVQLALQRSRSEAASQQRLSREGRAHVHRLEELLEEERARLRRCWAENEGIRRSLEGQAALQGSHSDPQASGSAGDISETFELRAEVERRYARVGELDDEQQRLAAEAARLRALLRQRAGRGAGAA